MSNHNGNAIFVPLCTLTKWTTSHYTIRNQLASVTFGGTPVVNRAYDDAGRLITSTFGNGLSETMTYPTDDNMLATKRIPSVTDFFYLYDANKRATQEVNHIISSHTQGFNYDAQDRLTSWSQGSDTQSWMDTGVTHRVWRQANNRRTTGEQQANNAVNLFACTKEVFTRSDGT